MRKAKADQIPSISSNSKQRNLSPRVSKVVRDFGRGFVEQTLIKTLANDGNFIKTEGVLNKGEMVKLIKKEGSIEVKTDAKAGNINSSKIDSNNNIVSTVTVYIEKGKQSIHTHAFTAWTTSSPATVFTPEVQTRTCSCGQKETRAVGSKLAPTIRLNAGSIVLKRKQRTNKLKVSGLAAGDSVKSWKSSNVNGKY